MSLRKTGFTAVAAILVCGAFVACGEKKGGDQIRARVQEMTGSVSINGQPAKVGAILNHGDRIETGADSNVHLLLEKRGGLTLRSETSLKLDIKDEKLELGVDQGDIIAAFHKIKSNENVAVITPTAIAGVRGTHFFIKVHHDNHAYVCTCNGRVHYQGHGHAEGEVTESSYHRAFHFKRKADGLVERSDAGMEHHEDHELERTADLIGKEIDWQKGN